MTNPIVEKIRNRIHDAPLETERLLDEAADYIEKLEAIVDGIDGALCNYCNQVGDPFDPPSKWDDYCNRAFEDLCNAYDNWHRLDKDIIGDITMRDFCERKKLRDKVAELEKQNDQLWTQLSVSTEDY
jgi:hypothetical protein